MPGLQLDSARFEGTRSGGKGLHGGEGRGGQGGWELEEMGQDWALGAVRIVLRQHPCPEGWDGGAPGSWGGWKAAVDPREDPSVSLGRYGLCSRTLHRWLSWLCGRHPERPDVPQDSVGAVPRAFALGYKRRQV